MTAKEKLEESDTFLKLIENEKNDLTKLRFYVSAFLTSIRSIPDHILQEANEQLHIGIQDSQKLYRDRMKTKAKEQKNVKFLKFLNWYDSFNDLFSQPPLDIVRVATNKNVHRKEIQFAITIYCTPQKRFDYEKPEKMIVEKTGKYKHFDTVNEIMDATEFARMEYLKRINIERQKHGDELENKIIPERKLKGRLILMQIGKDFGLVESNPLILE